MIVSQFEHWLRKAKRGSRVVYFRGFLMASREHHPADKAIQKKAWQAHEQDAVVLLQRRVGPMEDGVCEYIAVKL